MAFGHGIHYCLGVPLAKMQIEVALTRLITRFPDLRLAVDPKQLRWENNALLRGLVALPVSVSPGAEESRPAPTEPDPAPTSGGSGSRRTS
jgi:cytochrome P450